MLNILLVEDNPGDARLTREALADGLPDGFELVHEESLDGACRYLEDACVDVVLLDLHLPDADGMAALVGLRARAPHVPVIVLSGQSDDATALSALVDGAEDFVSKGDTSGSLLARAVRYAIGRRRAEGRLEYLRQHDQLTDLANRSRLEAEVSRLAAIRTARDPFTLIHLDLDGFSAINATLGYRVGDQVLRAVAERLRECVQADDLIARTGADEFAIVLSRPSPGCAKRVVECVTEAVRANPLPIGQWTLDVTASVACAHFPADGRTAEALLRTADLALSQAREQRSIPPARQHAVAVPPDVPRSLSHSDARFAYQPRVNLHSGAIVAIEVAPARLSAGGGSPLGGESLRLASAELLLCRDAMPERVSLVIPIARPFQAGDALVDSVRALLTERGPGSVELQVTAAFFCQAPAAAIDALNALRDEGLTLCLRGFGTGDASLDTLRLLPFDMLQIDGALVANIDSIRTDRLMVEGIIALAHTLGVEVTVGGVQNERQASALVDLGVDTAQGPLWCDFVPATLLRAWTAQRRDALDGFVAWPLPRPDSGVPGFGLPSADRNAIEGRRARR